ncbi:hypothetical protein [Legionella erythra]|uniref:Uncharacterized protein n=1 Tax=Legionella erythra TaxID=448 RepID=A0A0W0TPX1_LEGER|nr:hypothetical protein [Legionella erythra]KTC97667.1 hypothetical protein Lery_1506 [Legionella erythra]
MLEKIFPLISLDELKKRYQRLKADTFLMRAEKLDCVQVIFEDLLNAVQKPNGLSQKRFEAILYVKAQIYTLLISDKVLIDSLLDKLEQACADNFHACSLSVDHLLEKKLCPGYYQTKRFPYAQGTQELEEHLYYPVISQEILDVDYPQTILTTPLLEQLQKNRINFHSRVPGRKRFLESDGWLRFFGIVSDASSSAVLSRGQIFIEPPEFPHTVSRLHGPFGHALQEYLNSKLLEGGHLDMPAEAGVGKITALDLLKAEAWSLKDVKKGEFATCLFDLMRERLPEKLRRFRVVPNQAFAFTASEFITQYLLLSPYRFPCLSSIMYFVYAKGTKTYFQSVPGFSDLKPEEQLLIMNNYCDNVVLDMDVGVFIKKNPDYFRCNNGSSKDPIFFKEASKPFIYSSMDDDVRTIRARKTAAKACIEPERKHSARALYDDSLFSGSPRITKKDDREQMSLMPL